MARNPREDKKSVANEPCNANNYLSERDASTFETHSDDVDLDALIKALKRIPKEDLVNFSDQEGEAQGGVEQADSLEIYDRPSLPLVETKEKLNLCRQMMYIKNEVSNEMASKRVDCEKPRNAVPVGSYPSINNPSDDSVQRNIAKQIAQFGFLNSLQPVFFENARQNTASDRQRESDYFFPGPRNRN
mgnify:CR=1 FL=1